MPTLKILLSPPPPCASPVVVAFETIDTVTGMSLTHKKCTWIHGNVTIPQLSDWVGSHVPAFRQTQISNRARYLGVEIGPGAADHRWTKARNKFVGVCVGIRSSSQCQVQRLVSFKIFAHFNALGWAFSRAACNLAAAGKYMQPQKN